MTLPDFPAAHSAAGFSRSRFTWRLRTRTLPLGRRTLLMGIVNVTPDSFSSAHRFPEPESATDHGLRLLDEGADLLDIGGESTRPGSTPVPSDQEANRILPVIRAILRARPGAVLSVDTYHATTAEAALEAGVEIVNDISGLMWDRRMASLVSRSHAGAVLMHTRGVPGAWSTLPALPHEDILPLVVSGLTHSLAVARAGDIALDHVVLDPGFGFGKRGDENFALLAHFAELRQFNLPLLAGISRKSFLTAHLPEPSETERVETTVAAHVAVILSGAHLLRVHDLYSARSAASVADAILARSQPTQASGERPSYRP